MIRAESGKRGEEMVAEFLRQNGFIIVKMNYRSRFGEIDVIAENKTHIVFVEVKTRAAGALVSGTESVDRKKRSRIIKTAKDFLRKFPAELQPQFDVAEITEFEREDKTAGYRLNYIKRAF